MPAFPLSKNPWIFFYAGDSTENTFPKERCKSVFDTYTTSPHSRAAAQLHPSPPVGVTVPNTPN